MDHERAEIAGSDSAVILGSVTAARKRIGDLDKQINAIHRELRRREKINTLSAESWQDAWDKHPELQAQERDLYRQRGFAQQARDMLAEKEWQAKQRKQRAAYRPRRLKKCPTCGCHTLATKHRPAMTAQVDAKGAGLS